MPSRRHDQQQDLQLDPAGTLRPEPGLVLSERFRLRREIAQGSSGVVWEATDGRLRRPVALKLLHPHLLRDHDARARFRVEALATARVSHENVARLFDALEERGSVFLVMELITGPSLADLAAAGPLDEDIVTAAGVQIGWALEAAHGLGMIHRDVKPANVLVRDDGTLAVIDFGVAKLYERGTLTGDGITVGTARYVAPEQLTGDRIGPWTDVYSLGLLLWECVTGRPAFDGDSVAAVTTARLTRSPERLTGVDEGLADAVETATRRDPRERFASAAAFAAALAPMTAPRPGLVTRRLVREYAP